VRPEFDPWRRELEVGKSVRSSPCHLNSCLLGPCKFQRTKEIASTDNFVIQFLPLKPWSLQRILFAGSVPIKRFLEFKGALTVCLSVGLPVRQVKVWPGSNYRGTVTNTQGENKHQHPDGNKQE
jgi:hypothetical protein